jgi:hypothetical protein
VNRKLVLWLAVLGPVMGVLIVAGVFPKGVDRFAWMGVNFVCAVAIARARVRNPFWHGAVTGFLIGALATLVQGVFTDTYVAHNPWVLETFSRRSEDFDLQYFIMMLVPFIGLAGAFITGLLSYLVDKAMRPKEEG